MEIPVLIEPVAGNGYRVTGTNPFPFTVEGATEEETLRKFQELIAQRMASGARVVKIPVQSSPSWMKFVGSWKPDDTVIEEWKQAVEEFRRQVVSDADKP